MHSLGIVWAYFGFYVLAQRHIVALEMRFVNKKCVNTLYYTKIYMYNSISQNTPLPKSLQPINSQMADV